MTTRLSDTDPLSAAWSDDPVDPCLPAPGKAERFMMEPEPWLMPWRLFLRVSGGSIGISRPRSILWRVHRVVRGMAALAGRTQTRSVSKRDPGLVVTSRSIFIEQVELMEREAERAAIVRDDETRDEAQRSRARSRHAAAMEQVRAARAVLSGDAKGFAVIDPNLPTL